MIKKYLRALFAFSVFISGLAVFTAAQTSPGNFPNVKIKNFGQMDERYYRGAQPKKDQYQSLKDLGIKTVIDLRDDPTDYEKSSVEELGMKYINIPMKDASYPKPEFIEEFLKVVDDPETGIFFVHCKGGKHRTGVTGAVYRFTKYGWDYDQAYQEMKNYNFYSSWGYGDMKVFVEDYFTKMKTDKTNLTVTQNAATQNTTATNP